jgi:hypothetical protein
VNNLTSTANSDAFIIHKLPRPAKGTLLLTHDINIGDFAKFANGNERYSTDGYLEDAVAVYGAIGKPSLVSSTFACLTAHLNVNFHARNVTSLYGEGSNIVLIIDPNKARGDTIVFNGDIGRLGKALRTAKLSPSLVKSFAIPESIGELVSSMELLYENCLTNPPQDPRVQGNSFEARMFRGIRPTDVCQICLGNRDEEAMELARRVEKMRNTPDHP